MEKPIEWSPELNSDVIAIIKQEDGNYIGYTQKNGKQIEVRDIGPEAVLAGLLTHE
jgi:hypothetical protein